MGFDPLLGVDELEGRAEGERAVDAEAAQRRASDLLRVQLVAFVQRAVVAAVGECDHLVVGVPVLLRLRALPRLLAVLPLRVRED